VTLLRAMRVSSMSRKLPYGNRGRARRCASAGRSKRTDGFNSGRGFPRRQWVIQNGPLVAWGIAAGSLVSPCLLERFAEPTPLAGVSAVVAIPCLSFVNETTPTANEGGCRDVAGRERAKNLRRASCANA
jgi:hypothetical protein